MLSLGYGMEKLIHLHIRFIKSIWFIFEQSMYVYIVTLPLIAMSSIYIWFLLYNPYQTAKKSDDGKTLTFNQHHFPATFPVREWYQS